MKITYSFLNVTILKRENCPETRIKLINLSESNIKIDSNENQKNIILHSYLLPCLWSDLNYLLINHIEQIQDTERKVKSCNVSIQSY